MNTTLATFKNFEKVQLLQFIYEQGDDGMLIECKFKKGEKYFYSTISADFSTINELSTILSKQRDFDLNYYLSDKLLNNGQPFVEWNCESFSLNIVFKSNSFTKQAA